MEFAHKGAGCGQHDGMVQPAQVCTGDPLEED